MDVYGEFKNHYNASWLPSCDHMVTSPEERRIAGLITGVTAFVCFITDSGVAYVQQRTQPLHGCFAVLYVSMVCNECANLLIYGLFVAPILFTNATDFGQSQLARYVGHLFLIFWSTTIFLMLAISINRYVAIGYPVLAYFYDTCDFFVSTNWLGWVFDDSYCGRVMWWHCTISCSVGICILFSFNMATFIAIKRQNQLSQLNFRKSRSGDRCKDLIQSEYTSIPPTIRIQHSGEHSELSVQQVRGIMTKHRYGVYTGPSDELEELENEINSCSQEMRPCKNEDGTECIILSSVEIKRNCIAPFGMSNGMSKVDFADNVDVNSTSELNRLLSQRDRLGSGASAYSNTPSVTYNDLKRFKRSQKMKRYEIRFFVQAALNGMCFEGMIISFHLIGLLCHTPWGYLVTGNWPLLFCHGTNGFIMLLVHKKLRRTIFRKLVD